MIITVIQYETKNDCFLVLCLNFCCANRAPEGDVVPDVFVIAAKCFKRNPADLTLESSPYNTDGWDSLAHITLIHELEDAFNIEISPIDIINLNSLADVFVIVDKNINETG
ncbi:MAG: acyl carrier protein [Kordiimonadaceae bacterium]|nr:acyl carrier protein [Kordiimonadaceae bacterium]MBT6033344.1 acyl carrier protein [Kordiimonadaceae bacterium]